MDDEARELTPLEATWALERTTHEEFKAVEERIFSDFYQFGDVSEADLHEFLGANLRWGIAFYQKSSQEGRISSQEQKELERFKELLEDLNMGKKPPELASLIREQMRITRNAISSHVHAAPIDEKHKVPEELWPHAPKREGFAKLSGVPRLSVELRALDYALTHYFPEQTK